MHPAIQNEFRIFAHGTNFDVDAFLAATSLRPNYLWRRGDQRRYACIESKHPTSGVEFVLGDGRLLSSLEQEQIAIAYLQTYPDELRALALFPGVETFILGIQYICELEEGIIGFCIGPSLELMRHALDVGVEPHYYVGFNRCSESEDAQLDAPPGRDSV
jgi:hypothetical protein